MGETDQSAFYLGLPKRRAGAGALIVNQVGHVLIVEPNYKSNWEIPGGIVEAGEDPRTACTRECAEELGFDPSLGRLLLLEHKTEAAPHGDSIMFVYEGGVLMDSSVIQLQQDELHSHRFVAAEDLAAFMSPRLANRISHALLAWNEGTTKELVNGVAI